MKIALNLMFLAPGVAGGRVYAEELLRGLAEADDRNDYILFCRQDISLPNLPPERFAIVRTPVAAGSVLWRTLWEYGALPRRVRSASAQLWHGLGNLSPTVPGLPFVLTIHDVIYRDFPQSLPIGYRWFMRWMHPRAARRADRVIVPSNCSARAVERRLGVEPGRIRLVHYGPGYGFAPVADARRLQATLELFGIRRPFIANVCRGYQHKNLAGLVRALACLRQRGRDDVQLALIGEPYRSSRELERLVKELGLEAAVIRTGFVATDQLNALLSAATVFAFPSLAEGFGLPLLDAMSCGAPVVASNVSAIPEAVGDAGMLVDTLNPHAFADALAQVLDDAGLRQELCDKGFRRVRQFSWARCARETLAVYRELA